MKRWYYDTRSANGGSSSVVERKCIEHTRERTNQIFDHLWADTLRLLSEIRVANQKLSDTRALVGQPAEENNHHTVEKDAPRPAPAPVKAPAIEDIPVDIKLQRTGKSNALRVVVPKIEHFRSFDEQRDEVIMPLAAVERLLALAKRLKPLRL